MAQERRRGKWQRNVVRVCLDRDRLTWKAFLPVLTSAWESYGLNFSSFRGMKDRKVRWQNLPRKLDAEEQHRRVKKVARENNLEGKRKSNAAVLLKAGFMILLRLRGSNGHFRSDTLFVTQLL